MNLNGHLKVNNYSDEKGEQPPRKRGGLMGVLCEKEEYTEGVEEAKNEKERQI